MPAAGDAVCVIGDDIATGLFPDGRAVGKLLRLKNHNVQVVGIFKKQGKFLGLFSFDNQLIMPLGAFTKVYGKTSMVTIRVKVKDEKQIPEATEELTGLMRRIRRDQENEYRG